MRKIALILAGLLLCSAALSAQEQVSVGGITFYLADGYSVRGRANLADGETLRIAPDPNPDNLRLVLKVLPNALEGINGLTSEEVSDMLKAAVDKLAGIIADTENSGYTLDRAYRIRFEDDANCPIAYSDLSGKDQNGNNFVLHAEAALTDGFLISGCAIANNKANLGELVYIYQELMAGERDVPQGIVPSRTVSAAGISFDLYEDFSIASREPMEDGETVIILPKGSNSDTDLLTLILLPDILPNADRLAPGRLEELLKNSTRRLADTIADNFNARKNYSIEFDDDGLYPSAYANFNGKNKSGAPFICHTESTLVNGTVISAAAIGSDEAMLSRLIGTFNEVVAGAARR